MSPRLPALALMMGAALVSGGAAPPGAQDDPLAAAESLLALGDAERAATLFGQALLKDPANPAAASGRVRALIRQDLWQDALGEARELHRAHPAAGMATALGESLVRAGRLAEARSVLEPLVGNDAAGARALITYARVLAAAGEAEAETFARRAVEAAPEDRELLLWASDITDDRARTIELLRGYLVRADGDEPDRVTAARETLSFLEQAADRRFWVTRQRPERLELPLRPVPGTGGPAGYTIEMIDGRSGKSVRLLLDTGSTGLFMVERSARKLGLEPLDTHTAFGGGGDGQHATRRGVLPEVAFGGLKFGDALISTTSRPIHPTGAYHGVISLAAFAGYGVTLDLAERTLILGPPDELSGGLPYWTVAGQWLVEAAAGEAGGLFLLDTGTQTSVLAAAFASGLDDARLAGPANATGYGGPIGGARWVHGARVQFQGRSTPARPLRVLDLGRRSRLSGIEIAGFAGLDLLDRNRLSINTKSRRVRLDTPPER